MDYAEALMNNKSIDDAEKARLLSEALRKQQQGPVMAQKQEDPMSGMGDMMQNVAQGYQMGGAMGGGSAGGGAAALSSTGGAAGVSGGSMGPIAGLAASESAAGIGGAGAGGSGGAMSGLAAAGPWAALAAAIGVNEYNAKKGGYRAEDDKDYAIDLATSAVGNQDLEQRWLPKLGIKEGSDASNVISHVSNPLGWMKEKWF